LLHAISDAPDVRVRADAARKVVSGLDATAAALAYMMIYEQAVQRHQRCVA